MQARRFRHPPGERASEDLVDEPKSLMTDEKSSPLGYRTLAGGAITGVNTKKSSRVPAGTRLLSRSRSGGRALSGLPPANVLPSLRDVFSNERTLIPHERTRISRLSIAIFHVGFDISRERFDFSHERCDISGLGLDISRRGFDFSCLRFRFSHERLASACLSSQCAHVGEDFSREGIDISGKSIRNDGLRL
jgi:uncharacterized membrane protein YidH (DUF202 family)